MGEIKALSVRHDTIMDFLMANPAIKLGDVAKAFGMTQAWLSQVIHSDVFQAKLSEKKDFAFHHTVLPIRDKMTQIAHSALDQLAERIPMELEAPALAKIAEGVLDRLGFGTKATPSVQINNNTQVNVLRSELEEARALLGRVEKPVLGLVIEGERIPIGLPTEDSNGVRAAPQISQASEPAVGQARGKGAFPDFETVFAEL